MISKTTQRFWRAFEELPDDVKKTAVRAYMRWRENPHHPSLQFKRISQRQPIFSVRIGIHYRALGLRDNDVVTWFWIGSHADYDKLTRQL